MRNLFMPLLLILIIIFGCKNSNQKQSVLTENQSEQKSKAMQITTPNDSSILVLEVINGYAEALIYKKENQAVYLEFQSSGYKKLYGALSSEDNTANIRFSQIFMPDGTMDGPFGREIDYDLLFDGIYRLSVHEI